MQTVQTAMIMNMESTQAAMILSAISMLLISLLAWSKAISKLQARRGLYGRNAYRIRMLVVSIMPTAAAAGLMAFMIAHTFSGTSPSEELSTASSWIDRVQGSASGLLDATGSEATKD